MCRGWSMSECISCGQPCSNTTSLCMQCKISSQKLLAEVLLYWACFGTVSEDEGSCGSPLPTPLHSCCWPHLKFKVSENVMVWERKNEFHSGMTSKSWNLYGVWYKNVGPDICICRYRDPTWKQWNSLILALTLKTADDMCRLYCALLFCSSNNVWIINHQFHALVAT